MCSGCQEGEWLYPENVLTNLRFTDRPTVVRGEKYAIKDFLSVVDIILEYFLPDTC
jgi:hypothetical protein